MKADSGRAGYRLPHPGKFSFRIMRLVFVGILLTGILGTQPVFGQGDVPSPSEVIDAVNTLRAELGLPALKVDPILMMIAQNQADYQASIGIVTHIGPDGSRATDRAAAAGYGAGERVVVAENVASIHGSVDMHQLLYEFWADELHWNTMTKTTYRHIGVGVGVSNDTVYITLDAGWVANPSGVYTPKPASTPLPGAENTSQPVWIIPVVTVTSQSDGTVVHLVQYGQTLWGIATAYGLPVEDLAKYNGIDPEDPVIYPDQKILIPTAAGTATSTPAQETASPPGATPSQMKPQHTRTRVPSKSPTIQPTIPDQNKKAPEMDDLTRKILVVLVIGLAGVILVGIFQSRKK